MKAYIFSGSLVLILILHYIGFDYYFLYISLSILVIYRLLERLGKGIILMEIIMFFTCLTYLLMPILGYEVYNQSSAIARLWDKVMPVDKENYFEYYGPATTLFFLGLSFHISPNEPKDEGEFLKKIVLRFRPILKKNGLTLGIRMSVIGIIIYLIASNVVSFGYFGTLIYFLLFVGIMYMYFTPNSKVKYYAMAVAILFVLYQAYISSMFTVVIYMGATMASLLIIGQRIRFITKLGLFLLSFVFIFVIQSAKSALRGGVGVTNTFNQGSNIDKVSSEKGFFPMYVRFCQGQIAARVNHRIPAKQDFDNGKSIVNSIASTFVPRFVWPDKPQSGGYYNMKHFAGFILRGYTMNIGPPAEAYGNFGVLGGIVFMFGFGLFIRFTYLKLLTYSNRNPLLLLWLPLLYYQVLYCMENDVLQAVNSIIKGVFFMYVSYRFMPELFSIKSSE